MFCIVFIKKSSNETIQCKMKTHPNGWVYGAGDEARTRYLHLGKVALYRMSYTRIALTHDTL